MNFCGECGKPAAGSKFCPQCGAPVPQVPSGHESTSSAGNQWAMLRSALEQNWGSVVRVDPEIFGFFNFAQWRELQAFVQSRASHFLGLRTLEDYNHWIKQSDIAPFMALDTIETLHEALSTYIRGLNPSTQTSQLICAVGTQAQLPYGAPYSGASFYEADSNANVEAELAFLANVLRIGYDDNLIGANFDPYIKEIDLLSDFGRSFLVPFLGETPAELNLLKSWGPESGKFAYDMTSVAVVGWHAGRLRLSRNLLVNPRMIHFLLDPDNHSLPWWMEMAQWYSCGAAWKRASDFDISSLALNVLADYLEDVLDLGKDYPGAEPLKQDEPLYRGLIDILRG